MNIIRNFHRIKLQPIIYQNCVLKRRFFNQTFFPRRSCLYTPGDDEEKINLAVNSGVDTIIFDLDYSVSYNRKSIARDIVRNLFEKERGPNINLNTEWSVRINSYKSGLYEDDIEALFSAKYFPSTIIFPKLESIDEAKILCERVLKYTQGQLRPIYIILTIDSAKALLIASRIIETIYTAGKHKNLLPVGIAFGIIDFCSSIGAIRSKIDTTEVTYARQKTLIMAKAMRLQAIDCVFTDSDDIENLKLQCEQGANMGFTGKIILDISQKDIVHQIFLPDEEKIRWAKGLMRAYKQHQLSGQGTLLYKRVAVDSEVLRQATTIIKLDMIRLIEEKIKNKKELNTNERKVINGHGKRIQSESPSTIEVSSTQDSDTKRTPESKPNSSNPNTNKPNQDPKKN